VQSVQVRSVLDVVSARPLHCSASLSCEFVLLCRSHPEPTVLFGLNYLRACSHLTCRIRAPLPLFHLRAQWHSVIAVRSASFTTSDFESESVLVYRCCLSMIVFIIAISYFPERHLQHMQPHPLPQELQNNKTRPFTHIYPIHFAIFAFNRSNQRLLHLQPVKASEVAPP
jgi:hypothetical protein